MSRRAVITGIGVVAPNGIGIDPYWEATKQGRGAIRRISSFDPSRYATRFAGEVEGFDAAAFIEQRLVVQTDRWTWMAMAAARLAFDDAGWDPASEEMYRMSVITASSSGGNEFGQREIQALWSQGARFVGAYQSIAWFYAATTGQLSIRHGMKGHSAVVVSEQAGGLDSLSLSRRAIRRNGVDVVVAGGTEAPICPYALACQQRNGQLSRAENAEDAYRPFDARASGHVPGEGGAILLVEELEHAERRNARRIYGEILGYGATNDAYHPFEPAPDGRQLARAMTLALADARIGPEEVDVLFADATGKPEWDALEVKAIEEVFGTRARDVPVTAPKSMVGRLYAGGSSLDVATALLSMRDGVVPPTINLDRPADGCDLSFVTGAARPMEVKTVLVLARGFGGFNSALVLRKVSDPPRA
jgi:minimal PKS chain-length factor (CLF/KS beta)